MMVERLVTKGWYQAKKDYFSRLIGNFLLFLICVSLGNAALAANPWVEPGDARLRHDIQLLADHGILNAPITSWPLHWADVLPHVESFSHVDQLSSGLRAAYYRVRTAGRTATKLRTWQYEGSIGGATETRRIRSFERDPRGKGELQYAVSMTRKEVGFRINASYVNPTEAPDGQNVRFDSSYVGGMLGNWAVMADTLERWWGPGWEGSLILGNSARPVPGITIQRAFSEPFESPWLSWIGPWQFTTRFGRLESNRDIADVNFFGARLAMRPTNWMEVGFSRTSHWGGEGRPSDFDAFFRMLVGRDNRGDRGIQQSGSNEPGNQLAGYDVRINLLPLTSMPLVFHTQWIGEDESGALPAEFLGQFGLETWGVTDSGGSWRLNFEYANTGQGFAFGESSRSDSIGFAYNHGIYTDGYRYRGRPHGHAIDGDSELYALRWMLVDASNRTWSVLLRSGDLNETPPQPVGIDRHSLTDREEEFLGVDVGLSSDWQGYRIDLGAEYLRTEAVGVDADSDITARIRVSF